MTNDISFELHKSQIDALVAQRVRSAIAHLNLSRNAMAEKLQLDSNDWEEMLAGRKRIPAAALTVIAGLTGTQLASLFTGDFVAKN